MADQRIEFHKSRLEALRRKRSSFDSQWEEAAERLIPAHVSSFRSHGLTNAMTPGRKNQDKVFDSTAALALHRFTAVMESLSVPQGSIWHRLVPSEDALKKDRRVKLYMDDLTAILFRQRYRPRANFIGQNQKMFTGYGAYGNGFLFVDEAEEEPGLRYANLHLGETYVIENHQGIVDTMYRAFHKTPAQLIKMYGKDAVPPEVVKDSQTPSQTETELEVLHVIAPREDFDPQRVDAKGMPWESLHIFTKTGVILRESGYRSFPLLMSRYMQFTNETYGRGPAQIVLPAIKVVNEEKKTVIRQGHRVLDPVLLAHDDGVVGTFSMRPGAVNPGGVNAQGRPLVHVLPTGNIAAGKELMDDERTVINDAFLITLFQILVDTPQMTATEVLERAREKGILVAPTAGRLQSEYLGPMIERELDVLFHQGLLPDPPPQLLEAGGGFTVEYDNPISRMARAENAAGFMRSLDTALNFVQITQDPSPLDWFNLDVAMPAIQDINGTPTAWTNTPDAVQRIRDGRNQAASTQQVIDAAPSIAALAKVQAENARA